MNEELIKEKIKEIDSLFIENDFNILLKSLKSLNECYLKIDSLNKKISELKLKLNIKY